jgi:hypothetical protein
MSNFMSRRLQVIKDITQDGKVTLRGPVRSDDEKSNIEAKAITVAGKGNVTDPVRAIWQKKVVSYLDEGTKRCSR